MRLRAKERIVTFLMQVHVEALGYVGFGISPNGGMTGADVVIGWVSDFDGTPVLHVRIELNFGVNTLHSFNYFKMFNIYLCF